jgi:hypothetical protein
MPADERWFPLLNLLHHLTGIEYIRLQRLVERAGWGLPSNNINPEFLAWAEQRFQYWRDYYRVCSEGMTDV